MAPALQAKLLRVLQEGEIERVGGSRTIPVDVRMIAATNKHLEGEVEAGRFRQDLFWRLKVISIDMPALRQRAEDIPALVSYFLRRFSAEYGRPVCRMSDAALTRLASYVWPGNVRELENCVRRAVLLCSGEVISEDQLMIPEQEASREPQTISREQLMLRLREKLDDILPEILRLSRQDIHANIIEMVEESLVQKALDLSGNNQVQAARILGISRNTLRHRLKKQESRPDDPDAVPEE
jgi:DNA-binding NtrC family response regulator